MLSLTVKQCRFTDAIIKMGELIAGIKHAIKNLKLILLKHTHQNPAVL